MIRTSVATSACKRCDSNTNRIVPPLAHSDVYEDGDNPWYSARILRTCYWFEMLGIAAQSVTAEMVKLQAFGYWTHEPGVNQSVGHDVAPMNTNRSIAA